MIDEMMQAALTMWAARNLPGRLDVQATAKLLGFAEHDMQVLMGVGKLEPLGDPAPNAPKWFSAVEIVQLAADKEWLQRQQGRFPNIGGRSVNDTQIRERLSFQFDVWRKAA